MEQKIVKEAFGEALKDSEQEKKEKIKKIILETLRKKTELEEQVKEIQKEIKILGKDLEDFKMGRLDLIEERQRVDETAQKTSVVRIEKIINEYYHYYSKPWYEPYRMTYYFPLWDNASQTIPDINSFDGLMTTNTSRNMSLINISTEGITFSAKGTDFHDFFSGSYDIGNKIINL